MYLRIPTLTIFLLLILSCSSHQSLVNVPPNQAIELDYPNYEKYQVTLKNNSANGVDVAVVSKKENQQIRGFGLGAKAKANVWVELENKLKISNSSNKNVNVSLTIIPNEYLANQISPEKTTVSQKTRYKSFTLVNSSQKDIPLIIPNVMNPNLSPNSTSGVSLKVGQKVLFRSRGKKYILLTVDDNINNGDKLDVPALMDKRKKSLGLK